ncbi:hypothetical protein Q3G72_020791 [Acer saccharum]|nr:hypothetical protein Q3G72_020791 [Acer saccharum]
MVENPSRRVVGDSEEELVNATIAVENKHGKSRGRASKEAIRSKHIPNKLSVSDRAPVRPSPVPRASGSRHGYIDLIQLGG